MNISQKYNVLVNWVVVAYLSLVVEKFVFTGQIEFFRYDQGEGSMGMGLILINIFVLPFVQGMIWQIGGELAMYCMIAYALTSYTLCMKGAWKSIGIVFGLLALVFSLIWDLDMNPNGGFFFLVRFGSQIMAVGLVALLSHKFAEMFDKLGGKRESKSEN